MPHAQETAAIVPARSNQPKRVSLPLLLLRSPRTHWIRSTRTPLCYILVYRFPDDERSNPSPPSGDASQVRRGSSRCEATQRSSLERSWLAGSIQIVVLIDLGVATSGGGLCSVGCWPSTCIRLVSPQPARQALRESPLPTGGLPMTGCRYPRPLRRLPRTAPAQLSIRDGKHPHLTIYSHRLSTVTATPQPSSAPPPQSPMPILGPKANADPVQNLIDNFSALQGPFLVGTALQGLLCGVIVVQSYD